MPVCDPNSLLEAAKCMKCIPQGMQAAIQTQLLCDIANLLQPNYGFLSGWSDAGGPFINITDSINYFPVNNYVTSLSDGVVADIAAGTLTITKAGIYKVAFSASFTAGVGNEIEADLAQNGVPDDVVASHASASSAKDSSISAIGILNLPAGEVLSLMMKNDDSLNLALTHVQLSCHIL